MFIFFSDFYLFPFCQLISIGSYVFPYSIFCSLHFQTVVSFSVLFVKPYLHSLFLKTSVTDLSIKSCFFVTMFAINKDPTYM